MSVALKIRPADLPVRPQDEVASTLSNAERTKAALRAGGIDARVNDDGTIDAVSFVTGARKRWTKVINKLAE